MSGVLINLIIQIVAGAIGGNVAGGASKDLSLGTAGNTIAGAIGGGVGGQILSAANSGARSGGQFGRHRRADRSVRRRRDRRCDPHGDRRPGQKPDGCLGGPGSDNGPKPRGCLVRLRPSIALARWRTVECALSPARIYLPRSGPASAPLQNFTQRLSLIFCLVRPAFRLALTIRKPCSRTILPTRLAGGDTPLRSICSRLCILAAALLSLCSASVTRSRRHIEDKIIFGQVAALNGPAQALGQGMREGILAAFEEANRAGGVNGRKLELKSIDDSYEPEKTIVATNKAINEERVFALVGAVGTPTSKAGQPIATAAKVPFIGPFTGAEFLRNPFNRYVVNIRSSYFQETEAWIEHLTNDLGITRIAILYQDDAFGLAGLAGVKKAMAKRDMALVAEGTFKRNTTAIKSAMLEIMKGQPQAVVTVGPYKPIAEFIKLARQLKFDPVFVAISFVGSDSLAQELGNQGAGVID